MFVWVASIGGKSKLRLGRNHSSSLSTPVIFVNVWWVRCLYSSMSPCVAPELIFQGSGLGRCPNEIQEFFGHWEKELKGTTEANVNDI